MEDCRQMYGADMIFIKYDPKHETDAELRTEQTGKNMELGAKHE